MFEILITYIYTTGSDTIVQRFPLLPQAQTTTKESFPQAQTTTEEKELEQNLPESSLVEDSVL